MSVGTVPSELSCFLVVKKQKIEKQAALKLLARISDDDVHDDNDQRPIKERRQPQLLIDEISGKKQTNNCKKKKG